MKVVLTRKRFIAATALLTAAYLVVLITWAYVTPAFRSPDAPMHYNSIVRILNGGGWPTPGTALIDEEVLTVGKEGGLVAADAPGFKQSYFHTVPDGLIHGNGHLFPWIDPMPEEDRTVPVFGDGYTSGVDQMTQHPPVYYGIAAGYLKLLGADDWQWDGQLLALRILSALMVVWVVPATVYIARRTGLGRRLSLFAGLGLFAVPQLAHVGSSITNDSLYIFMGVLLLVQAARVLFGHPTKKDVILSGVLLGLGLWTKATFLVFGLVVGLSFVLTRAAMPAARRWGYGIGAGLLGVLIGGFWWIRNLIIHGTLQPSGMKIDQTTWGAEGPSVQDFLPIAWTDFVESFWGKFGWLEIPLPGWLIPTLTLCAGAMAVIGFISARGRRTALTVLFLFPVLIFAIILAQSWMNYVYTGQVAGMQGRYVYPGISGLAVLVAWSFVALRRQLEPRFAQVAEYLYAIVTPVISLYGIWWMLQTVYRDNDDPLKFSWVTWDSWSIATGATLKLWIGATIGVALILMLGGCYLARSCKHGDTPPAHNYPVDRDYESLERRDNPAKHKETGGALVQSHEPDQDSALAGTGSTATLVAETDSESVPTDSVIAEPSETEPEPEVVVNNAFSATDDAVSKADEPDTDEGVRLPEHRMPGGSVPPESSPSPVDDCDPASEKDTD